ncbi:MAG: T9SS type A sorting domain-containing protein [Bacteroidetes bacterium]|nr:T9SS type A sorting domain-containing protein [Bacteroidota bacterium]
MKKLYTQLLVVVLSIQFVNAQVPKKVVVEHFTNTKCSVCASKNPGFYSNLNSQTGVIHLAVHPSSPYAACVLSMHNPVENDGRTNYYGVYGSTPRLVIQGVVISSGANYSSASIFTPYLSQTSPASIKIYQYKFGNDSIRSRIVIKTQATHTLSNLNLFVALAEDTINYTGSNGEPVHYDVFRKSLTGTSGVSVTLPAIVGDSVVYIKSSPANVAWNFSRIFTIAILQNATTKAVIQSENISATINNLVTGIKNEFANNSNINIYFSENEIKISQNKNAESLNFILYDVSGRVLINKFVETNSENLDVSSFYPGIYLYGIKSINGFVKTGKLFIN